jgi:hypothetical protein
MRRWGAIGGLELLARVVTGIKFVASEQQIQEAA